MPVRGAFKDRLARSVQGLDDLGEAVVFRAVDASFPDNVAIGVQNVNLAKLLVRINAHAVVVGGVHLVSRRAGWTFTGCNSR